MTPSGRWRRLLSYEHPSCSDTAIVRRPSGEIGLACNNVPQDVPFTSRCPDRLTAVARGRKRSLGYIHLNLCPLDYSNDYFTPVVFLLAPPRDITGKYYIVETHAFKKGSERILETPRGSIGGACVQFAGNNMRKETFAARKRRLLSRDAVTFRAKCNYIYLASRDYVAITPALQRNASRFVPSALRKGWMKKARSWKNTEAVYFTR